MPVNLCCEQNMLRANLVGEIDHHGAKALREEIDASLKQNKPALLILDFREISFMDSSGIGLVMGRYRLVQSWGGAVEIHNPPPSIKKVMHLAGLARIAPIFMSPPAKDAANNEKTEAKR